MPLPEVGALQQGDILEQVRNPGFETENLPSPKGFDVAPIPIPGTGTTEPLSGENFLKNFNSTVLGATDKVTPGKLPQYTSESVYNPRYKSILPEENSEEAFAKAQPWYDKWGNALVKMAATAVGTFWNGLTAIPDTISSIHSGTPYDTAAGNAIDGWLKNLEDEFPNYYTKWQQDHPFVSALPFSGGFANFWGDKFLKNLGFTIGAIGGAVAQDFLVGSMTDGLGEIPAIGNQVGKAALWLNKLFTDTDKVKELYDLGRAAGRSEDQLLSLRNLARQAQAAKLANGTRFAMNLYGAAASEAGFEARDGYNTVRKDLMADYLKTHGYSPIGKDLEEIEGYAKAGANVRFGINLALLSLSDAIQFDSFIKPYSVAKGGYRSAIQKDLEEGLGRIHLKEGSIDELELQEPKTITGKIWGKIRPVIPNILAEGVYEEGGQYAAQVGTQHYYERKYLTNKGIPLKGNIEDTTPVSSNDSISNILWSTITGMGAEFGTTEGLENIVLGGITGAFSFGVEHFLDRHEIGKARDTVLNTLNSIGVTGIMSNNYDNTVSAHSIAEDMKRAVAKGNIFDYKNLQHEQFAKFIISGAKAGRFDVRMEQLDLLANMDDDKFKQAFGFDKTTENVKTVQEYIGALKDKARDIKRSYDLINDTFRNYFDYNKKAKSKEQVAENANHMLFESWKDDLTFLASVSKDVKNRVQSISRGINQVAPNVSVDHVATLTNPTSIQDYKKELEAEAKTLDESLKANTSLDKKGDTKKLSSLNKFVKAIDSLKENFEGAKYQKLFENLLNYRANNGDENGPVKVPPESVAKLIQYGIDINRLETYQRDANHKFDILSTEKGFKDYVNSAKAAQAEEAVRQEAKQQTQEQTQQPGQTQQPQQSVAPKMVSITSPDKVTQVYDTGKSYAVKTSDDPETPLENVEILGQSPEGVIVKGEDGQVKTIPNEVFFIEDTNTKNIGEALNDATSDQDTSPPLDEGNNGPDTTKRGEAQKDLSFGPLATTDPPYDVRTTPDDNFQKRHQNFLFHLGSTDPEVFNQDNKPRLRIIPVNAKTQGEFGFSSQWIDDKGENADKDSIRAVYIIDNRLESGEIKQLKNKITNLVLTTNKPGPITESFKTDPEQALQDLLHQYNSGETTRQELLGSLNDNITEALVEYANADIFFTDEHGEKLGRITEQTDPNKVVYTNFSTTDLQFEGQPRYTNKQNLDEKAVQDWWRDKRKDLLSINTVGATPIFQFDVSRGMPKISNYDVKNTVLEVGLVREADLDTPVITVVDKGNVAIIGAFNQYGEGIGAAKSGVNIPLGREMLNFGGNLIYLNRRKLSIQESKNVFDLIKVVSDKSSKESKTAIFNYLNKILYLANPTRGLNPTTTSVTIEGNSLFLGLEKTAIQMSPESIEENKEKIVDFLLGTYHNVRKKEIDKIAKNPKANDLQFNELHVVNGKVEISKSWKNYNHYLLNNKDSKGNNRGTPPLTTNLDVPIAGEVPIIQKYSVIRGMDFDSGMFERTQPSTPLQPPPTPQVVETKNKEQGVKTEQPKAETKAGEPQPEKLEWVEIPLGDKLQKWLFKDVKRDAAGNIIDMTAVGRLEGEQVIKFEQPEAVKELLLKLLQKNQVKQDETNTDLGWLGNPDLKKGTDPQYRDISLDDADYRKGDLTEEFAEARRMLGDDQLLVKVNHVLKTTSGGLAYGAFVDNVIYVWKEAKEGTTYHEVFERVYNTFLTGKEQQELYNEFTRRDGSFKTLFGENKKFSEATIKEAKEQIAEEFSEYKLTGKLPEAPKARTFFQRLIDFIKKIIFGDSSFVNQVFDRINRGYYRNFSTSTKSSTEAEYHRVGLEEYSEAFIQDTLQGMTIEMFLDIFKEGSSVITQLEENPNLAAKTIYDRLRDKLTHYFENTNDQFNNTLAAEFNTKYLTLTKDDDKEAMKAQILSIISGWKNIKTNWDAFVREHQRYMKIFGVEYKVDKSGFIDFAEDEDLDEGENKSQSEYARDIMQLDARENSSTKVKLLVATVADSRWKQATAKAIAAVRGSETEIKRDNSLIGLPKMVQYAKLFNYMLHNLTNINGIYAIWDRMKGMVSEQERKEIDANVQRLMMRTNFDNGFEGKTIDQARLIISLENALSKQKPGFFRQFVDQFGDTYFKTSMLNSKTSQVKEQWMAGIKGSQAITVTGNALSFSPSLEKIENNVTFLNKLGINITQQEYSRLQGSDVTKFNEAVNKIRGVVEKAIKDRTQIPAITGKGLDMDSRLNALSDLYVTRISGEDSQSQHPNLDDEPTSNFVLNNAVSMVLNDANLSATREEFVNKIGNQYFNDIFHKDSILLNRIIFNQDGNFIRPVEVGVVEGREAWSQDNISTSKLTGAERQVYGINDNLKGVFYTLLPADAKTEWAINTGLYLSADQFFGSTTEREEVVTQFASQMYRWLQTEINLAKDYDNRKHIEALTRVKDGRPVGKSLRFFKDILPKEIVDRINTQVIDGNKDLNSIISEPEMREHMRQLAGQKAIAVMDNLFDWRIIDQRLDGTYSVYGFDKDFLDTHLGRKRTYTRDDILSVLGFREMNYILNNIEMHKFFFGDPAQYKDELKRIKSFLSGREVTHVDYLGTSEGYNQAIGTQLNQVNSIPLQPNDPGYHNFKNHANTFTLKDVIFESNQYEQIKEAIGEKNAEPYTKGNEADAQTYISSTAYREVMHKSNRFNGKMEDQWQWEMAWERNDKAKNGLYTYTNKELEKADNEILKREPDSTVNFPILKLVHSGITYDNDKNVATPSLHKASWAPLFYRWYKGKTLGNLYNLMQQRGTDYVTMESANKVGIVSTAYTNLYNKEGEINSEGISKMQDTQVPYKQLGVQVEQRKKDTGQTEGSQARNLVSADIMSNGVPTDYIERNGPDLNASFNVWNDLTEEQKLENSPIYQAIKRHDNALQRLVDARTERQMQTLGITTLPNGDEVIEDKKKVSDFILNEIERRELPRNIAYMLEVQTDSSTGFGEFEQPLEANAQYKKIRDIIYSIINKTVMRPKVNGGQKTMLSVTGFESGKRIVKKIINGKPVYTSDELKSYVRGKDGTEACEVYLSYHFGEKLREMGSGKTEQEVLKYLNSTEEGRKLLSGIGFRIPTQGLNSIDFFIIKGFLPEQMGDVIVLPSDITVKAGSDFDIDKLNTYLRNFYVDNTTGYPKMVQWKGTSEATKDYISKLLDAGNVISAREREELDRIIVEETEELDPNDLMMKIPGVMSLFSEEAITKDFLRSNRDAIIDKLHLQAMENEFFDSIEGLLSMPRNYAKLVTPNSADEMKGYRDRIKELKGISEQENQLGDYGKLVDSQFMTKERQAYMASKGVVGISAVSQVFHAQAQKLPGGLLVNSSMIQAKFPHTTINGKLSLSGLNISGTDNLISNINSQTTDGGVDVAKDKFLAEMGINGDTLSTFLTILKMSANPWWDTLFINQPAIQEYLKIKAIDRSVSAINPGVVKRPDWQLMPDVINKFKLGAADEKLLLQKPDRYTISQMEDMMKKYYSKQALNVEEQRLQLQMLDDYKNYNNLAWELFHSYQGYNWGTAVLTDPNAIRLKMLKYKKANELMITGIKKLMEATYMEAFMNNTLKLDRGLSSLMNVQVGAAGTILDRMAEDLFIRKGLNEETRRNLLLTTELGMVDYAIQTNAQILGNALNTYINPVLLGDKPVARYIKAIQKSSDKRLSGNPFIKNLVANIDNRTGQPSTIKLQEREYDTYTSNVWTDSFRELKDDATVIKINDNPNDDRTVAQIYKNLVLAAILQNGSRRTSASLTHLIPNETYSEFTRSTLRNMNLEGFYENNVIYRANWWDNQLVPYAEKEQPDWNNPFYSTFYFVGSKEVKDALKGLIGPDKTLPLILRLPEWKYANTKVVKFVGDPTGRDENDDRVRLFARVDVISADTEAPFSFKMEPLSIEKKKIIFKQINAWGMKDEVQEYHPDARPSVLPNHVKVNEVTDDQLLYALLKAGRKTNAADSTIDLINQKFDDSNDMDDLGNETPDNDPIPTAPISPGTYTNHSGGAEGADKTWDEIGQEYGVTDHRHYRPEDYTNADPALKKTIDRDVNNAAKALGRPQSEFKGKDLVRRNWFQVDSADEIFAVSRVVNPGEMDKGFRNTSGKQVVSGGTGWAVEMAIQMNTPVHVFDMNDNQWKTWDGKQFVAEATPSLTNQFAGIGSRSITEQGKQAMRDVYEKTVNKKESTTVIQGKTLRSLKSSDAKQIYKDIQRLDSPTSARGLAMEYLANGGKISPETLYNEVIAKRDERIAPTKKGVSEEVKSRDYVEKGASSIKEIAHDIWDNLDEGMKNKISDTDIRNELIGVIKDNNKRLDIAKDYLESGKQTLFGSADEEPSRDIAECKEGKFSIKNQGK